MCEKDFSKWNGNKLDFKWQLVVFIYQNNFICGDILLNYSISPLKGEEFSAICIDFILETNCLGISKSEFLFPGPCAFYVIEERAYLYQIEKKSNMNQDWLSCLKVEYP